MSNQMQFAPFREMNDAIGQAQNYAIPEFSDLSRLSNRITNNLLYYQTNYLVFFIIVFFIIGIIHPQQFILGLLTFVAISVGYVVLTDKNPQIQRLKRDKPYLNLAIILILSAFLFNLLGSLMTFLFSICMPLSVIFLHAALRLRNIKNKIANKIELIGVSRTPMGFLLEQLGATHEAAS